MKKTIGIYMIKNDVNGRVYIGQSINVEKRLISYKYKSCKMQPRLYRSLAKYGVGKHTFTIIEECEIGKLNERERYWQEHYQACGKNGMNCVYTKTDNKKQEVSEYTRKKQGIAHLTRTSYAIPTDEIKKAVGDFHRGKLVSEATKEKLRRANLGKKHTDEHKKKISDNSGSARLVVNLETGIFYDTIKDIAIAHNKNRTTLCHCLRGRNGSNKHIIYA